MLFSISPQNELIPVLAPRPDLMRITDLPLQTPHPLDTNFCYSKILQATLEGKKLLFEEISISLEEIQEHYLKGYCAYHPGIRRNSNKLICARCGNKRQELFASYQCARCKRACAYCRNCVMMGRISECSPLISWTGPATVITPCTLEWQGSLSPGQQHASSKIVEAVERNSEILVWAVCGAGKTEVLFKGIEKALSTQKRVCIATPRTDVVLELTPRLQRAFPTINVIPLYGDSGNKLKHSSLFISTTHQLYRFEQAFDLIILDEMDAFPYSADETLQHAINKARKSKSTLVYLTATPNKSWQRKCKHKKIAYVKIPARYHRHPLPVPRFIWCGNWEKLLNQGKLPQRLLVWLKERLSKGKQILLFLPKIAQLEKAKTILGQLDSKVESVFAADPHRIDKVKKMRNKEINLLITTTILERGVTFPNIDVAVLGAENDVFTDSALIQIAGRAGRSSEHPDGDVVFFHHGKTWSMVEAKNQIENSNKEAAQTGMLLLR